MTRTVSDQYIAFFCLVECFMVCRFGRLSSGYVQQL